MRVVTPQITWHNRDPVLCVDFDPSHSQGGESKDNDFYRLATGGSDTHVLIWHVKDSASVKVEIGCVADLTRHTKAVNTLRFSPCGKFLASADDDAYVYIWKNDSDKNKLGEEFWTVEKGLRKHIDDVSDMSWSADSARLVTSSVDNSAIIWDVKKGTPIHVLTEHVGFVQGVNFDPMGEFVATISTDRLLRVFNPQTGKLSSKALKYPSKWLPKEKTSATKDAVVTTDEEHNGQPKKSAPPPCNRIFHDDTLKSYCRRLSFSPRGEFLVVPGGILPPSKRDEAEKSPTKNPDSVARNSKKINNAKEKPVSDRNAVILFCRSSFKNPCSVIPTGISYSIAARFCPLYFQRHRELIPYDKDLVNPAKKSERLVTCVGKLKEAKKGKKMLLDMPYRLVFAVGTNDSLIISDTDSVTPLAVVRNIHLTRLSDMSWSADGRLLVVSSTDGYCSLVSFDDNELGLPFTEEVLPVSQQAFPIPPAPVKEKASKPAKKRPTKDAAEKKEKEPKEPKKVDTPTTPSSKKKEPARKTPVKGIHQFFKGNNSAAKPKPKVEVLEEQKMEIDERIKAEAPSATDANLEQGANGSDHGSYEEMEAEKDKIAITPKRCTFLERWLKKSEGLTSANAPTEVKQESETSMLPSLVSSPLQPIDVGLNYSLTGASPKANPNSSVLRPLLSPEQIHQLQNAPIIINLEEDEAENEASIFLSSTNDVTEKVQSLLDVVGKSPVVNNGGGDAVTPINQNPPKPPTHPICTTPIIREKRPATSPLSSHQKPKQPRRVEFITLPKSPRKDE